MNINPKMMKQAMKKLGMKQEEIEAYEVIIKTKEYNIILRRPQVSKVVAMGQESYQISGDEEIVQGISEEDINTVAEQANVTKEQAKQVLEKKGGNLASAILDLKKQNL